MPGDNLELLMLEREKRRRQAVAPPTLSQQVISGAGTAGQVGLEAVGAPDQLAGEAIRVAREGYPLRLPSVAQRIPGVQDIDNRYVTAQQQPSSFVGEVASGVQGVAQGALAGVQGQNPLTAAAAEIARPKDTLPDAIMQTGFALGGGQVANAPLNAATKAIGAVAAPLGKSAAYLSSLATNVKPKDYETLFKNPGAIIPGSLKKAGAAFEAEASKLGAGIKGVPTKERIKALRDANNYAFDLFDELNTAKNITPGRALLGRQAVDKIYPTPNDKNGTYRALLDQMRDAFQSVVAKAPEMQKTSKEYAIAKAGEKFLSPVPRTISGKPGLFRSAAMAEMVRRGNYGAAAAGSPVIAGAVTAGAGITAKLLAALAKNDPLKAALLSAYLKEQGVQQ